MRGSWCLIVGVAAVLAACDSTPYASHRPFVQVPTLDGAVLSPARLVTILPANIEGSGQLVAFSAGVGGSAWWTQLAQEYGLGAVTAAPPVSGPAITTNATDHDLFLYIDTLVTADATLARDGHTIYLLYLPASVVVVHDGKPNTGCTLFGAYHVAYGTRGDNLAIVQQCTPTDPVDNMTIAASHEILESATDPDNHGYRLPQVAAHAPWTETVWNAFNLTGGAELADLCVGTFWVEAGAIYQRIWSNAAALRGGDPCLPALQEPYYDTDFARDWYSVDAGASVTIPVTGWATGSVTWPVNAFLEDDTSPFTAALPSASGTLTPGAKTNLIVTAAANAPSGTWSLVRIESVRPPTPSGERGLTDGEHSNFVGVYVP